MMNIVVLLFSLLLLCPSALLAREDVRVVDSFVINSQTELLLFFGLSDSFTPKMEQGIDNGIPVSFTFFIELSEQQEGQQISLVLSKSFKHTILFDTLKNQYKVVLSERNNQEVIYTDFNKAKYRTAVVSDFVLIPLARLKPQASYIIKIKSSLVTKGLPGQMSEMVTFLKLWDFETNWHEFSFAVPKAIAVNGNGELP